MMEGESVEEEQRERENGRKGGGKIVAETTFSTKGRGGRNERWGKAEREKERKKGDRGRERAREERGRARDRVMAGEKRMENG